MSANRPTITISQLDSARSTESAIGISSKHTVAPRRIRRDSTIQEKNKMIE